ncbi:MAG: toll/interleukin-1 receptor domain-containing protein [Gemmataceae bacterium]
MKRIVGIYDGATFLWRDEPHDDTNHHIKEDGIGLIIQFIGNPFRRRGRSHLQEAFTANGLTFVWESAGRWFMNLDELRGKSDWLASETWAKGIVSIRPNVMYPQNIVEFNVYKVDYEVDRKTRIFLSHKGADKPTVRTYYTLLKELGFDPWLDEEDMPAGTELHRGILDGFEQSCAAVFFITTNFKDESYLRSEVNYAKEHKRKKGDRFSIITIVLPGKGQSTAVVPELLKEFVYKSPDSHVEAFRDVIRALPLQLGPPRWRDSIGQPDS